LQLTVEIPSAAIEALDMFLLEETFASFLLNGKSVNSDIQTFELDLSTTYLHGLLLATILHRLPTMNDGTKKKWMGIEGIIIGPSFWGN